MCSLGTTSNLVSSRQPCGSGMTKSSPVNARMIDMRALERGSRRRQQVTMRFLFPGYVELLTGRAHDDTIDSNDKRR